MDLSVDQMVDFLTDAFQEIDKETLFLVLQASGYNLDRALETLIAMESDSPAPPPSSNSHSHTHSHPSQLSSPSSIPSTSQNRESQRGAKISLPDDFLRAPGWREKRQEYVETGSLVNLMADPIFLQELEREFGPNYQAVLREHLQAEALRNTVDQAPYSDHPNQRNNHNSSQQPRQFLVQGNPSPYSGAPYTHQYYNQTPPPYSLHHLNVGQQQPPVLAHQTRSSNSNLASSPPSQSSSSSWFTSPFSSSSAASPTTQPSSQSSTQMVGFGGGSQPPPRDDGPSISDRFQNILQSFTSKFSSDPDEEKPTERRGLLSEEVVEEEEGSWEGGGGIQMDDMRISSRTE